MLSLLDGPSGCDPAFCVVWFRFRLLRRYLALWPSEVGRVSHLLGVVSGGCPGHGPIHLLSASAAEIGFRWDSHALAWIRPGLPFLCNLAGPIQHFRAVWSAGALPKRGRLVLAVRDRAFLPGRPGIWCSEWLQVPATAICADDIALWPYTPGLLVKWVSFLNSLHWPVGDLDLGVGGVSFVEMLILYGLWAGERLSLEKAHPRYLRPGRQISVSVVPFGPGIDIWRSCRFLGSLMRSLCLLPGGLRRFVPCSIGANHCRLRHIGWEKCGHGLTSRPRESF